MAKNVSTKDRIMANHGMDLTTLMNEAHNCAVAHGWWEDDNDNDAEKIALMHSELSEALEDLRSGHPPEEVRYDVDGKPGKPGGVPIELADVIIRIFDYCGRNGIDIEAAVVEKMNYNQSRPYKHGGKIF